MSRTLLLFGRVRPNFRRIFYLAGDFPEQELEWLEHRKHKSPILKKCKYSMGTGILKKLDALSLEERRRERQREEDLLFQVELVARFVRLLPDPAVVEFKRRVMLRRVMLRQDRTVCCQTDYDVFDRELLEWCVRTCLESETLGKWVMLRLYGNDMRTRKSEVNWEDAKYDE